MIDEARVRGEICRVGASLYQRGYTVGSAGNISARLEDGYLMTPTDACLGTLQADGLTKLAFSGERLAGPAPSKTFALHRGVYEQDTSVNGIVHTHSTHLVALTLAGVWRPEDVVPPITPYHVMKVGHIPLVPYHRPGDPKVAAIAKKLAGSVRGVLIERLGPIVWESSVSRAAFALEELEETARLWLLTLQRAQPLDETALDELRETFGARW